MSPCANAFLTDFAPSLWSIISNEVLLMTLCACSG